MIADVWPLSGLELCTARLVLRLPDEGELADLAALAGRGLHAPAERPFLTPWTEGTAQDRERAVLQGHWSQLGSWRPDRWQLGLAVLEDGVPLGVVTLRSTDFAVVREVTTSSWLGLAHQGRGVGTEARVALLTLAFDHLGALAARTEVFVDNHASQGVSRRLGYVHDGTSRDRRGDEALVSDRLRLDRATWSSSTHPVVEVRGLDACRSMFG